MRAKGVLLDGQGTLVERFGIGVTVLVVIKRCQVIETDGNIRVMQAEFCPS